MCCSASRDDNSQVHDHRPFFVDISWPEAGHALRAALAPALMAVLLIGMALPAARASDDNDHERAREAVRSGQVLPLPTLLQRMHRTHPGQVLELELDRDDGRWIYEVKLLQASGQLLKLKVDAASGQVLQAERKKDSKEDRKQASKQDGKQEPMPDSQKAKAK